MVSGSEQRMQKSTNKQTNRSQHETHWASFVVLRFLGWQPVGRSSREAPPLISRESDLRWDFLRTRKTTGAVGTAGKTVCGGERTVYVAWFTAISHYGCVFVFTARLKCTISSCSMFLQNVDNSKYIVCVCLTVATVFIFSRPTAATHVSVTRRRTVLRVTERHTQEWKRNRRCWY